MLFGEEGINGGINHQLIGVLVEIHVHKDSLYYHATMGVDFYNYF